jgi:hypothetical protein
MIVLLNGKFLVQGHLRLAKAARYRARPLRPREMWRVSA